MVGNSALLKGKAMETEGTKERDERDTEERREIIKVEMVLAGVCTVTFAVPGLLHALRGYWIISVMWFSVSFFCARTVIRTLKALKAL